MTYTVEYRRGPSEFKETAANILAALRRAQALHKQGNAITRIVSDDDGVSYSLGELAIFAEGVRID